MKVSGVGEAMSNAEVARWMKQKRAQHAREDAEDRAASITPAPRPKNFMKALDKHERHLASDAYPYEKNPGVYQVDNAEENIHKFGDEHMKRIQEPLAAKYKDMIKKKLMTVPEAQKKLEVEQEKKELTEAEFLMIYNHAPTDVEYLKPMIEDADDRFTQEELESIQQAIKGVFRADEVKSAKNAKKYAKKKAAQKAEKAKEDEGGEENTVQDDGKEEDLGKVTDGLREMSPFFTCQEGSTGVATVDYDCPLKIRPGRGPQSSGPNAEPLGENCSE